jgi:hypothetical protein
MFFSLSAVQPSHVLYQMRNSGALTRLHARIIGLEHQSNTSWVENGKRTILGPVSI